MPRYYLLRVTTKQGHRVVQVMAESLEKAILDVTTRLYPGSVAKEYKGNGYTSKIFLWSIAGLLWTCGVDAGMHPRMAEIFKTQAEAAGVPVMLLRAVCWVESTHKVKRYPHYDGGSFSYGICHVKLATAKMVGYTGEPNALQYTKNSVMVAARYLKMCLDRNNGDRAKALTAYNAGLHNRKRLKRSNRYVILVLLALHEGR